MKQLLYRLWRWLGQVLGVDAPPVYRPRETDGLPAAGRPVGLPETPQPPSVSAASDVPAAPPPVTLPPPPPPQLDLHTGDGAQFGRKSSIVTQPEARLYRSLVRAVDDRYRVMAKVRLWDFIWLVNDPPERKQFLTRLSCRHVDFLLCEPYTLKPLLAIELDDYSHRKPEAQAGDRFKDELFAAAGLPLLRLNHPNYPPAQLRAKIAVLLDSTPQPE